jgi:type II secretion system protein G
MRTMLLFVSIVLVSSAVDRDGVVSTEATLRELATCVTQFKRECGRLPRVAEGLDVLVHRPPDWPEHVPWTPFIETECVPKDGWNNAFVYLVDPGLAEGFGIYSCGRDGVSSSHGNDRDDLNTWSRRRAWFSYYEHWAYRMDMQDGTIGLGLVLLVAAAIMALCKTWKSQNRSA